MSDRESQNVDERPEEEDDVDEYFDNLREPSHLPADHPLMKRLQEALKTQLSGELVRVDLQLREKEEHLKKLRKQKEDTGVQLYGVQQQLAQMQVNFEKTHDNYNIIERYRKEAEEQLQVLQEEYEKKKVEVEDQNKKVLKAQDELNHINRTLKQVEEYNNQMKSEIAVSRTTTYSAEVSVVGLEKMKKKQDVLIDHMNEEIRRLNEQHTLLEAQLKSQREQTEAAKNTLKEAAEEMEKIGLSKKDLMNDWQEYLRGMQRRGELLQTIETEINKQREQETHIDAELNGYKNEINQETHRSEKLVEQLEKNKLELETLKKKMEEHRNKKDKLDERYRILRDSQNATEEESNKLDIELKNIRDQKSVIEKNIMRLHQETKALLEDIMNNLSEQTIIEKRANNLVKKAKKMQMVISEKQAEHQNGKNEIARVKIDVLNTKQWIQVLKGKKSDIDKELTEKENMIKDFDKLIRQNHDELEKKQLEVDKLNREYAKLTKDITDDSAGPDEAKLNSIERDIAKFDGTISTMERDWITLQTRFVDSQTQLEEVTKNNLDYRTKLTILEQRKLRLNGGGDSIQKEIVALEISLKNLRTEMNRINVLLDKNRNAYRDLIDENRHLERDFVKRLEELESETSQVQANIDKIKQDKQKILDDIVEAERQILLWERKIQLESEMQKTIDPNVGQKEMQEMKKEIHRMELKLEDLRKNQEKLILEMERAVSKRETISIKYQPRIENKVSKSSMPKIINGLRSTLKNTTQSTQQLAGSIAQRRDELQKVQDESRNLYSNIQAIEQDERRSAYEIVSKKLDNFRLQWMLLKNQNLAKRYDEVTTRKFKPSARSDQLQSDLNAERETNAYLSKLIEDITSQNPHLQRVLEALKDWE